MIVFRTSAFLLYVCCLLLHHWRGCDLVGRRSDTINVKTTTVSPSLLFFFPTLLPVKSFPIQRNQNLHRHNHQQQSLLSTGRIISTVVSATQQNSEGLVIPLVSRDRFRFRNLTQSIQYSIVLDDSESTETSFCINTEHSGSIGMDTNGHDYNNNDTFLLRPRRHRASTARFTKSATLWYCMARSYKWIICKLSSLRRLFRLLLFKLRLEAASGIRIASAKGFSEADLGGTKRHYALLIASLLSASGNGLGMFGADPLVYHHSIIRLAHQRTVASLSSSSLSKAHTGDGRTIEDAKHAVPISALQRHALLWIENQRRKTKS